MLSVSLVVWRLSRGSSLTWKAWDDEYVVFNVGSGSAHLLDALTGEALAVLEREEADANRVTREVAAELGVEPSDELQRRIEAAIAQLHRVDLIESVAS